MSKAILTHDELRQLISEAIYGVIKECILFESQESKSIDAAKKLYIQRTGQSVEEADDFVRITLRNDIPTLRSKDGGKFILGVTRMYLDGQLRDANSIARINSTLKYVSDSTHINQYDRNLNGLSAQELIERFAPVRANDMKNDREALGKTQFNGKKEYKVIRIDSFEQIRQYGKYNDWCLAQDDGENMYERYTADGVNQLYLILHDGFENEPEEAGPDAPYDSYGLSMMTVIVDPDGQMVQSTTRWNHEYGSSDSAFTTKTISETIGRNFYEVFKPNTNFKDAVSDAERRLAAGENVEDIFSRVKRQKNFWIVKIMNKYTVLKEGDKHLNGFYFDSYSGGRSDFTYIGKDEKFNLLDPDGALFCKKWYDDITEPNEYGYYCASDVNKENYTRRYYIIAPNGDEVYNNEANKVIKEPYGFLIEEYGDYTTYLHILNKKGQPCGDEYTSLWGSYRDHVVVENHGVSNILNVSENKYILDKWYPHITPYSKYGVAVITGYEEKENIMNYEGHMMPEWFDEVYFYCSHADYKSPYYVVKKESKYNIVDGVKLKYCFRWDIDKWTVESRLRDFNEAIYRHGYQ